ncbi:MAG: DinB family protein [Chloroflexota bacterium]|nr:MAG: DinB family protein [Chloroflexota bacterium]
MDELTRAQVLEHLRSDYGGLRERLEELSPADAARPGLVGSWSAQQLMCHVVGWEEECLRRLRLVAAGRGDEIKPIRRSEVEDWNTAAVERLSGEPWANLLERWVSIRAELVQAVETLTEEQFANPVHHLRVPLILPNFAWAHEAEHARELSS